MSSDAFKDRQTALEEEYFQKQNEAALKRIQEEKDRERVSPINGKPMEQVTMMGVVIDRCPESGGIWLDAGELEEILESHIKAKTEGKPGFLESFVSRLSRGNAD